MANIVNSEITIKLNPVVNCEELERVLACKLQTMVNLAHRKRERRGGEGGGGGRKRERERERTTKS